MTITAEQKRDLADGYEVSGLEFIAEDQLFMDSHGCQVVLVVVKKHGSDQLLGFTYRYSSEESFYEDDPMELVPVRPREVVKTVYDRYDMKPWIESL
jgi:hypothetical protein